jgi:hypothetical protein
MTLFLWQNVRTAPNRWVAAWLRRRGWVCFYLDEAARHCGPGGCWLQLYREIEARERKELGRW